MAAEAPTILATSGGFVAGVRTRLRFAPLLHHACELARVEGRRPRLCHVGTAMGDQRAFHAEMDEAAGVAGVEISHLNLFPMPPVDDVGAFVLSHDLVWVGGGSVANLLAVWAVHGLGAVFEAAWHSGVVLSGVSAGSVCWHAGGTTDSFGPELRAVTNGLGFLPYSNGVHYDSEPRRRPLLQQLIGDGVLPDGYATDDGVGLVYRGTELAEAVTEVSGKGAYRITKTAGGVIETRIEPRVLPGALPGG